MCEFCEGNISIMDEYSAIELRIKKNFIKITDYEGNGMCEEINFCPKCGRKLND